MKRHFSSDYDEDLSLALYVEYKKGDKEILGDLVTHLLPLVRRCSLRQVASISDRDDLEADLVVELYSILTTQHDIPTDHPRVFKKFLLTVLSRSIFDLLKKRKTEVFDFLAAGKEYHTAQLPRASHVDLRIYRHQITRLIRKIVRSRVRFVEYQKACFYLIDIEIGLKKLAPETVRQVYPMTKARAKWLENYIRVVVRTVLWELGERERKDGPIAPEWATG